MSQKTALGRLENYFKMFPNQRIDGRALSAIAGEYAWRTRVSELRLERNMNIKNKQTRMRDETGKTHVVSEYIYIPDTPIKVRTTQPRKIHAMRSQARLF